jgi:hypothetical protein
MFRLNFTTKSTKLKLQRSWHQQEIAKSQFTKKSNCARPGLPNHLRILSQNCTMKTSATRKTADWLMSQLLKMMKVSQTDIFTRKLSRDTRSRLSKFKTYLWRNRARESMCKWRGNQLNHTFLLINKKNTRHGSLHLP